MGSINVNWNQWCPEVTSDYWELRNPEYNTITFDNGVATRTITTIPDALYKSSIRIKSTIQWYSDHLYYFKQELFPSKTSKYYVIFGNNRDTASIINCPQDEWTFIRDIKYASATGMSRIYLTYTFDLDKIEVGDTCKVRNPILVDLTQMYGAGNEPSTVQEFEHQCEINGINLNEYQPYTTGIIKSWRTSGDGTLSTATTSGNIASFWSPTRADIKSCKVYFSPVQEGSGDPGPTNVRNINGWNGINGYHTRKNLLNIDALISSPSNIVSNFNFKHYLELKLKPNTYYTVSTSYNDSGLNVLYANGVNGDKSGVKADTPRTVLSSSNGIVFLMLYDRDGIEKFENKEVTVQLEEGNIVTSYEPVNNIPVSWQSSAGTVYGGYVDLVSGELVADMVMNTYDGSDDENWKAEYLGATQTYNFYIPSTSMIPKPRTIAQYSDDSTTNASRAKCNQARPRRWGADGTEAYGPGLFYLASIGTLNINGGLFNVSTVEEFKAYLSQHPLQVTYELATPITYQLTPQQLTSFIGRNNIWSNADNTEVTYDLYESADITLAKKKIYLSSPHIETVHSGNTSDSQQIAAFKTDMNSKIKSLKVSFAPIQEGSGDPSPTNIRPISGHTGLTVKQTGVNLLQCDTFTDGTNKNITYTGVKNLDNQIESVIMKGTGNGENGFRNLNYTAGAFKLFDGRFAFNAYSRQANIQPVSNKIINAEDGSNIQTHTSAGWYIYDIDQSAYTGTWARIQTFPYNVTGIEFDTVVYPMMCLALDQGCEFEPYKGKDISVSFPSEAGTVYGGYVDLVNGELVATHGYIKIVGNEDWIMSSGISGYCAYRPTVTGITSAPSDYIQPICDKLKGVAKWATGLYEVTINNGGNLYFGAPEELSTKAAVNAWIQEIGGIDVVFPLNTPVIYQLTPQIIKTLIGRNNIWSDAGDVEVQYWKHENNISLL